ncbi:hypothetical protein ACOMHN_036381 [Nucella lapillus]
MAEEGNGHVNGVKERDQRLRRMQIELGRARLVTHPWELFQLPVNILKPRHLDPDHDLLSSHLDPDPDMLPSHLDPDPDLLTTHLDPDPHLLPSHLDPDPDLLPSHLDPDPHLLPSYLDPDHGLLPSHLHHYSDACVPVDDDLFQDPDLGLDHEVDVLCHAGDGAEEAGDLLPERAIFASSSSLSFENADVMKDDVSGSPDDVSGSVFLGRFSMVSTVGMSTSRQSPSPPQLSPIREESLSSYLSVSDEGDGTWKGSVYSITGLDRLSSLTSPFSVTSPDSEESGVRGQDVKREAEMEDRVVDPSQPHTDPTEGGSSQDTPPPHDEHVLSEDRTDGSELVVSDDAHSSECAEQSSDESALREDQPGNTRVSLKRKYVSKEERDLHFTRDKKERSSMDKSSVDNETDQKCGELPETGEGEEMSEELAIDTEVYLDSEAVGCGNGAEVDRESTKDVETLTDLRLKGNGMGLNTFDGDADSSKRTDAASFGDKIFPHSHIHHHDDESSSVTDLYQQTVIVESSKAIVTSDRSESHAAQHQVSSSPSMCNTNSPGGLSGHPASPVTTEDCLSEGVDDTGPPSGNGGGAVFVVHEQTGNRDTQDTSFCSVHTTNTSHLVTNTDSCSVDGNPTRGHFEKDGRRKELELDQTDLSMHDNDGVADADSDYRLSSSLETIHEDEDDVGNSCDTDVVFTSKHEESNEDLQSGLPATNLYDFEKEDPFSDSMLPASRNQHAYRFSELRHKEGERPQLSVNHSVLRAQQAHSDSLPTDSTESGDSVTERPSRNCTHPGSADNPTETEIQGPGSSHQDQFDGEPGRKSVEMMDYLFYDDRDLVSCALRKTSSLETDTEPEQTDTSSEMSAHFRSTESSTEADVFPESSEMSTHCRFTESSTEVDVLAESSEMSAHCRSTESFTEVDVLAESSEMSAHCRSTEPLHSNTLNKASDPSHSTQFQLVTPALNPVSESKQAQDSTSNAGVLSSDEATEFPADDSEFHRPGSQQKLNSLPEENTSTPPSVYTMRKSVDIRKAVPSAEHLTVTESCRVSNEQLSDKTTEQMEPGVYGESWETVMDSEHGGRAVIYAILVESEDLSSSEASVSNSIINNNNDNESISNNYHTRPFDLSTIVTPASVNVDDLQTRCGEDALSEEANSILMDSDSDTSPERPATMTKDIPSDTSLEESTMILKDVYSDTSPEEPRTLMKDSDSNTSPQELDHVLKDTDSNIRGAETSPTYTEDDIRVIKSDSTAADKDVTVFTTETTVTDFFPASPNIVGIVSNTDSRITVTDVNEDFPNIPSVTTLSKRSHSLPHDAFPSAAIVPVTVATSTNSSTHTSSVTADSPGAIDKSATDPIQQDLASRKKVLPTSRSHAGKENKISHLLSKWQALETAEPASPRINPRTPARRGSEHGSRINSSKLSQSTPNLDIVGSLYQGRGVEPFRQARSPEEDESKHHKKKETVPSSDSVPLRYGSTGDLPVLQAQSPKESPKVSHPELSEPLKKKTSKSESVDHSSAEDGYKMAALQNLNIVIITSDDSSEKNQTAQTASGTGSVSSPPLKAGHVPHSDSCAVPRDVKTPLKGLPSVKSLISKFSEVSSRIEKTLTQGSSPRLQSSKQRWSSTPKLHGSLSPPPLSSSKSSSQTSLTGRKPGSPISPTMDRRWISSSSLPSSGEGHRVVSSYPPPQHCRRSSYSTFRCSVPTTAASPLYVTDGATSLCKYDVTELPSSSYLLLA